MRLLHVAIVLLSISGLSLAATIETTIGCNCWHCDDEEVIGLGEETTTHAWQAMYKEDSDDDGDRTICARNRAFNDRTFPSVCHMLCYNRCTRYRLVTVQENDVKKYVVVAYRPNYYKLRNGKC
ncbi:hypothetical protein DMN91_012801 [Ooceraea biroi]|uniref:Uncharacterized protein n=1 Tax=Ooceraea biroi TaxID=2015173 RepID=A0A026VUZ4_OOCBI|nr:uncharacterized protein LOC105287268 isoform X2 [Ooceraea biroi]EZA46624.1 hypothetical protein X777_04194 [Ooceraea biroi]RLU14914.1 hypothetical protein DMN91_012801 [Ooceraea biroi]